MQKEKFEKWLKINNISNKMVSDHVSRVMRLERVFTVIFGASFSFEKAYQKDRCESLISLLRSKGDNPDLKKYSNIDLPIGKSTMACIRYSLRTYCRFLNSGI